MKQEAMQVFINMKLKSPNAFTGNTKYSNMNRQRQRKKVLQELKYRGKAPEFTKVILIRHCKRGFDKHDNLRTAFKGVADGVQDYLGIDDSKIDFEYDQKTAKENRWRGKPKPYGIEIIIVKGE